DKCDFCGRCADFCMYNALAVTRDNIMIFPELCHSCGGCKLVCPKDAINYESRTIGSIEYGRDRDIDFYRGIANVGEVRTIPIIRELKNRIQKEKITILDAPPGAGCSVIETIEESDFCILVTEPTPFGLYDLRIAVDVVRRLKIPFGVVINKYGIGDRKLEIYCSKEDIPILMKIPFDRKIASLYSSGIPFVERMSEWKNRFREMFGMIEEKLK
ncbi:MAG TPA: (4Fe-4S)-binding protein, partial [Thermoplasmatales archaeon]|nr:(4Fe-4S)-binding protein [Thermoplasmatales archaeon]